jgi:uncharacterized protein
MRPQLKRILLFSEFMLLFFGAPVLIITGAGIIHPSAVILPLLILIFIYLGRRPGFSFRELVRLRISGKDLVKHGIILLSVSAFLVLSVYLFKPENLFNLPRSNIKVYILICTLYPVFSAFGQEIIYRVFLNYRYREVFRSDRSLILAGSLAFSFVHIVYFSYISIVLTFFLGLYLTYTYLQTRSVLLTAILHGFLGDVVFTVGLGSYFWLDMYKWM